MLLRADMLGHRLIDVQNARLVRAADLILAPDAPDGAAWALTGVATGRRPGRLAGRRRLLGVITVDDVLEVVLPEGWRRREAAEPPDPRHGGAR